MTSSSRYLSLRDYLRVLRDHRVMIVVVTAVFCVVANRISNELTKTYNAQASVAMGSLGQDLALAGLGASTTDQLPAQTPTINAETISNPAIIDPAAARLRHRGFPNVTSKGLKNALSARVEAQSSLVILQVSSSNESLAVNSANAVANQDVAFLTQQEDRLFDQAAAGLRTQLAAVLHSSTDQASRAVYATQIAKLRSLKKFAQGAQVTQYARPPVSTSGRNPVRDTILAGLAGLTIAIVVAFLRSSLDRRVRSAPQIQRELGVSLLSRVAASAMGRAGAAQNARRKMTPGDLEAFRILHSNLDHLAPERRLASIAVTSPLPEEGKSTVATSLAFASCWAGRRTLLIEADLRRPSLARRAGLQTEPGLSELLMGTASLNQAVQRLPSAPPSRNGDGSAAQLI